MSTTTQAPWTMPAWMEPYRSHINNTGGNPIEELMNDTKTNGFNNSIRLSLIIAVQSQVMLLTSLYNRGLLADSLASMPETVDHYER